MRNQVFFFFFFSCLSLVFLLRRNGQRPCHSAQAHQRHSYRYATRRLPWSSYHSIAKLPLQKKKKNLLVRPTSSNGAELAQSRWQFLSFPMEF
ncbi:hypothetical protein BC940DRAFT_311892, partial [Gongronella butleri]